MLNVVSSKLTGTPGTTGWGQVHEFEPQDAEKLLLRGKLFLVIATSQMEQSVDVIAAGRELIARVNEEYFGNLESKPFYALKSAIQKVSGEFIKSWGQVEIGALVVLGDIVYAASEGGCGVLISRGGSLATILQSHVGESVAASGYPKEGDVILLATQTFLKKVPFGVIKAALGSPTPEEGVETLAPIIHGISDTGSLCAEILQFKSGASKEIGMPVSFEQSSGQKPVGEGLFEKLQTLAGSIGKIIPKRNIYIKPAITEEVSPQSKKATFSVAIILLILLAVSIVFGIKQKRTNDLKNRYRGILQQSINEVDQAISLASVSPDRSRELFADAQGKLSQIESMNVKDPALDSLRQKIESARSSILGEYNIPSQMFLDLTLLSSGFKGSQLALTGGQVYVMDSAGGRIVSVDISTKKSKVVAGPGVINSAASLAGYESKVFVLESDGVYEVESGSIKVISKTWAGDALIAAFAGNIYVLDKSGNSIYRYQGGGINSFASKQNWLAAGTNANFANTFQIAIDGSVYVLYPNAKILKFSQGSPQNFNVKGVVPEIGNIDAISASPDNQNIYLLDGAGKRIVVTDKKGFYKAQYVDNQIANAINLVASEDDKKIILLTGDKLYSIDIAQ